MTSPSKHKRFMFTPFWKLTQWGFLAHYFGRINHGGDGVYRSRFIIIPLVGDFVWFDKDPDPNPLEDE